MSSILNTFRSSRRMHTKRRGGAKDNECDICLEPKTTFDKLNCKKCSDKGSKICKECAGIIKIQKKNCPMCRGEIQHSFTSLRDKIAARKKVEEMELAASASRRRASPPRRRASPRRIPASPPRRPASTSRRPVSTSRRPASPPAARRLSPNTVRAINTRELSANNRVLLARTAASAASRREISRNRI